MTWTGMELPRVQGAAPGPHSRALAKRLAAVESRNVTFLADSFPIFWERARGALVEDADGNTYLDFSSAFGVAFVGHNHPRVVESAHAQLDALVHGMGDVHPPALKVQLCERLAEAAPAGLTKTILSCNGSDAVESALKTAFMATGKPGVIAFEGAYHGLGYGALAATHRDLFRGPFRRQLGVPVAHVPFPTESNEERVVDTIRTILKSGIDGAEVGAVIIEPIQGRAGVRPFSGAFLTALREACADAGACFIADEIFTGCGRTGTWWGVEDSGVVPDLVCTGKALAGGFPLSACIGSPDVMDAWPRSEGEAIHTSTFLGNPLGCAMALAVVDVIESEQLCARARTLGEQLKNALVDGTRAMPLVTEIRGRGLFLGIQLNQPLGGAVMRAALAKGLIVFPGGAEGDVISISPPAVMTDEQLEWSVTVLLEVLGEVA